MPTAKPKLELSVIDMHTGGEPLRIVPNFPFEVKGASILVKRKYFRENYDHIRKFLMHEPRGHAGMYGAVVVESDQAPIGVLFMHNEGYSTFCGHGVIALARWAVDSGKIERSCRSETRVDIECPAGVVKAFLCNVTGRVRFVSMPVFSHSDGRYDLGRDMHRQVQDGRLFIESAPDELWGPERNQPNVLVSFIGHAFSVADASRPIAADGTVWASPWARFVWMYLAFLGIAAPTARLREFAAGLAIIIRSARPTFVDITFVLLAQMRSRLGDIGITGDLGWFTSLASGHRLERRLGISGARRAIQYISPVASTTPVDPSAGGYCHP